MLTDLGHSFFSALFPESVFTCQCGNKVDLVNKTATTEGCEKCLAKAKARVKVEKGEENI